VHSRSRGTHEHRRVPGTSDHRQAASHSQPSTTQRYAHLDADPMRRAVATIGSTIRGRDGGQTERKVADRVPCVGAASNLDIRESPRNCLPPSSSRMFLSRHLMIREQCSPRKNPVTVEAPDPEKCQGASVARRLQSSVRPSAPTPRGLHLR
jgi:hypothetical protein